MMKLNDDGAVYLYICYVRKSEKFFNRPFRWNFKKLRKKIYSEMKTNKKAEVRQIKGKVEGASIIHLINKKIKESNRIAFSRPIGSNPIR